MSATDLAHDEDDNDDDDDDDDDSGFFFPATFPQTDLDRIHLAPFIYLNVLEFVSVINRYIFYNQGLL